MNRKKFWQPAWTDLRKLGASKVIRSSYFWFLFVPIAAKFVSQLPDPLRVSIFGHTLLLHLELPFNWFLFYFSAVCFALASGLYSVFCPKIIKEHSDFTSFYKAGEGSAALIKLMPPTLLTGHDRDLAQKLIDAAFRSPLAAPAAEIRENPGKAAIELLPRIRREELTDLFDLARTKQDRDFSFLLNMAFVLYVSGFLLLGLVGLQGFKYVLGLFCAR